MFLKKREVITTDALYILLNIVYDHLFENQCKCFDTIYRNALWMELSSIVVRIVTDMYQNVKLVPKVVTNCKR